MTLDPRGNACGSEGMYRETGRLKGGGLDCIFLKRRGREEAQDYDENDKDT
jgi:hypothetical protein